MMDTIFDSTYYSKASYPPPWDDYISKRVPIAIRDALYWCEYVVMSNQLLNASLRRLVSYFITEVEITEVERKEQERIKDYLYDTLFLDTILFAIGMDYLTYGNSFVSVYNPVIRVVTCPKCKFVTNFLPYALQRDSDFSYNHGEFKLHCNRCGYTGAWITRCLKNTREDLLNVIRWNVHDIELNHDPFSGRVQYIWKIPAEYKGPIESSSALHLAYAPDSVLSAIETNSDYLFDFDQILHLYEPALAGLRVYKWGLSPILANFRQTWYIEVLKKANQTIAYDYILPLRIISPETRGIGPEFGDAALIADFYGVNNQLASILQSWRKDPSGWYSCPFPIRYQVIGGEAARIIPQALIEQANIDLICGLNLPVEFYRGNLTVQGSTIALRMLEGCWSSISKLFNRFLQYLANVLSSEFSWDTFKMKLARPSTQDDINRQIAKLQLAAQGIISLDTGLKGIGVSYPEELRKKTEEEALAAEESMKLQEQMGRQMLTDVLATPLQLPDMQQTGSASVAPGVTGGIPVGGLNQATLQPTGGGAGGAGGGAAPTTSNPIDALLAMIPDPNAGTIALPDLISIAEQIAQQIYGWPAAFKASMLIRLQRKNEAVHAMVKEKLRELDQNAALQGKVQARQQAGMGAGGMPM